MLKKNNDFITNISDDLKDIKRRDEVQKNVNSVSLMTLSINARDYFLSEVLKKDFNTLTRTELTFLRDAVCDLVNTIPSSVLTDIANFTDTYFVVVLYNEFIKKVIKVLKRIEDCDETLYSQFLNIYRFHDELLNKFSSMTYDEHIFYRYSSSSMQLVDTLSGDCFTLKYEHLGNVFVPDFLRFEHDDNNNLVRIYYCSILLYSKTLGCVSPYLKNWGYEKCKDKPYKMLHFADSNLSVSGYIAVHKLIFLLTYGLEVDKCTIGSNSLFTVDHIDGVISNNKVSNLQLLTRASNTSKHSSDEKHCNLLTQFLNLLSINDSKYNRII